VGNSVTAPAILNFVSSVLLHTVYYYYYYYYIIIIIIIIIILVLILNLFSPISYLVAVFWQVQISTTDQSDLPQHFTNDVCSAH
jgi:uncharacterized protein involved in cysteine biosynthesis